MPCCRPSLIQPLVAHLSLDHPPVACHPDMPSQYVGILQGLFDNKVRPLYHFPFYLMFSLGCFNPTRCLVLWGWLWWFYLPHPQAWHGWFEDGGYRYFSLSSLYTQACQGAHQHIEWQWCWPYLHPYCSIVLYWANDEAYTHGHTRPPLVIPLFIVPLCLHIAVLPWFRFHFP